MMSESVESTVYHMYGDDAKEIIEHVNIINMATNAQKTNYSSTWLINFVAEWFKAVRRLKESRKDLNRIILTCKE